jgi:hypothetical protein
MVRCSARMRLKGVLGTNSTSPSSEPTSQHNGTAANTSHEPRQSVANIQSGNLLEGSNPVQNVDQLLISALGGSSGRRRSDA